MVIPRPRLPVGFRFQPTDKEVFDHYLRLRNLGHKFSIDVPDIDVTILEPWEVPVKFGDVLNHQGNDNEWWFFSPRTRGQTTRRKTGYGKWSSTCENKKIMDGDKNQIMGIMKTFAFHYAQGPSYKRLNWILHEYHLANLPLPDDETFHVLCRLNHNKDDRAKKKTGGEVGHSGIFEIDQQEVPQTNGEISSRARQRKRTIESIEIPPGIVNQESIFTNSEQQMHPQDHFFSSYQPQSSSFSFDLPQLVELLGSDSSTLELSWGSSSGSGSSGVDSNRDILSNSLEDQTSLYDYDEQLQMEMILQSAAAEPLGVPTFQSLPQQAFLQDCLLGDTSSSAQPNTYFNRRAQSSKSLSGVVPAEEKKTSVENRNARTRPSSSLSPPAVCSAAIVAEPKVFEATNSPASAKSFPKVEERVVDKKSRLKMGSELTRQNPHSLPATRLQCLANAAFGLVMVVSICSEIALSLKYAGVILPVGMLVISLLKKSES